MMLAQPGQLMLTLLMPGAWELYMRGWWGAPECLPTPALPTTVSARLDFASLSSRLWNRGVLWLHTGAQSRCRFSQAVWLVTPAEGLSSRSI